MPGNPLNNPPRKRSFIAYALDRILYHLKNNPKRLLHFINPSAITASARAHNVRESLKVKILAGGKPIELSSAEWEPLAGRILKRRYTNYDSYINLQSSKLEVVEEAIRENEESRRQGFRNRFLNIPELKERRSVLCLGARLGTEVHALIELGHLAVGTDINPGERNPYVVYGDIHTILFADASFDAIFTNIMDHCLDPKRTVSEVKRVLKPGGLFIINFHRGYDEGMAPEKYDALAWPTASALAQFVAEEGNFKLLRHYELPNPPWTEAVFLKP